MKKIASMFIVLIIGCQTIYGSNQSSRITRTTRQAQNNSRFRSDTTRDSRQNRSAGQRADWNKLSLGQKVNR